MRKNTHGGAPSAHFTIQQNSTIRDARLSFRARGVIAFIQSHEDGWHITADGLVEHGTEGREALRTAFTELVEQGYLRRYRHQDEDGKWRTDLMVYPNGDAPIEDLAVVAEEDLDLGPENRRPENRRPETRTSVTRRPETRPSDTRTSIEDHLEDSPVSPSSAAAGDVGGEGDPPPEVSHQQQPEEDGSHGVIPKVRTFPVTEQRKLTAWFGITSQNEADSWLAAWQAAEGVHVTSPVFYDPEAHLAMYLSRCRTERRTPRADLWLRFFIEDRAKHMETIAHVQERVARQDEDPQQREDRTTRALPPADWGTTGEEVPDEG